MAPTHDSDVLATDREFFSALVERSLEGLNRILAEEFILINVQGAISSKSPFITAACSGELKFESIEPIIAESLVRFFGETAVVTGRTEMSGQFAGTPFTLKSRYTHVFVEQQGGWRMVSAQGTQILNG